MQSQNHPKSRQSHSYEYVLDQTSVKLHRSDYIIEERNRLGPWG